MKIDLIDNYVLTTDPCNYIINERVTVQTGKNKGKEGLNVIGFYPTLVQALEGLINEKMLHSKAHTLNGLVKEHTELVASFKELLPKLKEVLKK